MRTLQVFYILASAPVALILTLLARDYAVRRALIDVPNDRSSHASPTPRGGGVSIVVTVLIASLLGGVNGWVQPSVAIALAGGGILVAAIGWLDDHRSLSPLLRAVIHVAAAVWAVAWLGGLPTLSLGSRVIELEWFGGICAVIAVVWAINFYNFMDGSDGFAAGEAATVGLAAGVLTLLGGDSGVSWLCFIVAAAAAAFLLLNWSPARVFMGDVGSGFLGFAFAVLALASERSGALPAYVWVLLLGVFVFDSTVTLTRRIARGEAWYTAHRRHAYQRLIQSGWDHARVCLGALVLNAVLVLLALIATQRSALGPLAFLLGMLCLSIAYRAVERRRPMALPESERITQ
jgi:Fuc2NAc and GlcNAc transferase